MRVRLYEYQAEFIRWSEGKRSGILGAEMGTGKTVMSLALISKFKRVLIICPSVLLDQWEREALSKASLSREDLLKYHGTGRKSLRIEAARVILTTRQTLLRSPELWEQRYDRVLVDEAHEYRNEKSQGYRKLLELRTEGVWLLTGTPCMNGKRDLINLLKLLRESPYDESDWWRTASVEEQRECLSRYYYKISKDEVLNLPEKRQYVVEVELSGIQAESYKRAEVGVYANGLVRLLRLRQALLLNPSAGVVGQKYERVSEILERVPASESVLIFSSFKTALEELSDYLKSQTDRVQYKIHGGIKPEERAANIKLFNETGGIFLISIKAGGVGLNLVKANHVILLDPYWNEGLENQAIDRAHRIGQEKPVSVYKLIAKGTVEERIVKLQVSKNKEIRRFPEG